LEIFEEWKRRYGVTFPLYGNETVRNDISGSVRPLLSGTAIPHEKILTERSKLSKKVVTKIIAGEKEYVTHEEADKLLTAMDMNHAWYEGELADYY
jgi:hypothetical protein